MAKSKKKPTAQNIAFIERIEIQIKEKARQRMLKRAPKPASASISSTDILNQQYLLQRTMAQRIQPQPQQQSQTVNVYLGDVAKLQQQETLKRIDEDASAAIIRQQRGGINDESLNFILASLLEQKQQVKKQQPPPESFDYGFVKEGAVEYKEEMRSQSVAALERLNKSGGPRSVAFETVSLLPAPRSLISEQSRRRAITPEQRRSISVEASERASILSKMTAEEFRQKYPDLTGEIMRQSAEDTKKKYVKRRAEINAQIQEGSITRDDGLQLLKDFATGIGYDVKPRLKEPAATTTQVEITSTFSASQERDFPKTTAVMKKKSQTSTEQLNASISANIKPSVFSETVPAIGGGGQSAVIQSAKSAGTLKKSGRQMAARLIDPSQPSILQSFSKVSSAAQDLEEIGGSSPVESTPPPTPPSSRPSTAESRPKKTGESFTRPGLEIVSGTLPRLAQ